MLRLALELADYFVMIHVPVFSCLSQFSEPKMSFDYLCLNTLESSEPPIGCQFKFHYNYTLKTFSLYQVFLSKLLFNHSWHRVASFVFNLQKHNWTLWFRYLIPMNRFNCFYWSSNKSKYWKVQFSLQKRFKCFFRLPNEWIQVFFVAQTFQFLTRKKIIFSLEPFVFFFCSLTFQFAVYANFRTRVIFEWHLAILSTNTHAFDVHKMHGVCWFDWDAAVSGRCS